MDLQLLDSSKNTARRPMQQTVALLLALDKVSGITRRDLSFRAMKSRPVMGTREQLRICRCSMSSRQSLPGSCRT